TLTSKHESGVIPAFDPRNELALPIREGKPSIKGGFFAFMGHEYWRPGAVDNLPYSASPTVGRTPAGLGLVELTIGATSKGDRAYGFIENNYPEIRPQSRTDTSN